MSSNGKDEKMSLDFAWRLFSYGNSRDRLLRSPAMLQYIDRNSWRALSVLLESAFRFDSYHSGAAGKTNFHDFKAKVHEILRQTGA